jgi:phosphotriesterase-related protein
MPTIMTALGPIAPETLGFTSMHEHILCDLTSKWKQYGEKLPEELRKLKGEKVTLRTISALRKNPMVVMENLLLDEMPIATAEVSDYRAAGGSAILEMSVPGMRMNVEGLRQISQQTGVHIVLATGLYVEASWPDRFLDMSVEQLTDYMVKDVEVGLGSTGIKAGHVKAAADDLSAREERSLRAAARAAVKTGLSMSVHPPLGFGGAGLSVLAIVKQEGLSPDRLIMCHSDYSFIETNTRALCTRPETWRLRLDYARKLLDHGVTIALDGFGKDEATEIAGEGAQYDWQRFGGLLPLVEAGYASQIVLGQDTAFKMELCAYGGEGYVHLPKSVVPALRDYGVSDYDIRQMTVKNPARLLTRQ